MKEEMHQNDLGTMTVADTEFLVIELLFSDGGKL